MPLDWLQVVLQYSTWFIDVWDSEHRIQEMFVGCATVMWSVSGVSMKITTFKYVSFGH